MLDYIINKNKEQKLRAARAKLLVALRDLAYADAKLMEDTDGCDYCRMQDGKHSTYCPFDRAVDLLFRERATEAHKIRDEALELRAALVSLSAEDYLMLDVKEPCTHCDGDDVHTDDCPLRNSVDTVKFINDEGIL